MVVFFFSFLSQASKSKVTISTHISMQVTTTGDDAVFLAPIIPVRLQTRSWGFPYHVRWRFQSEAQGLSSISWFHTAYSSIAARKRGDNIVMQILGKSPVFCGGAGSSRLVMCCCCCCCFVDDASYPFPSWLNLEPERERKILDSRAFKDCSKALKLGESDLRFACGFSASSSSSSPPSET